MNLTYYTPPEPIEIVCKSCGRTATAERSAFPDVLEPVSEVECERCDWCPPAKGEVPASFKPTTGAPSWTPSTT